MYKLYSKVGYDGAGKEIEMIHTLVISSHCYVLSSQLKPVQSITQPPTLLAGLLAGKEAYVHAVGSNSPETIYVLFKLPYKTKPMHSAPVH